MERKHMGLSSILVVVGVLAWAMVVLGLYFWVHKPLTPALARALAGALLDGVTSAVLVISGAGIGRRVTRLWRFPARHPAEHLAAEAILGMGLLSLILLGVGVFSLGRVSVALALGACLWLTRRDVWRWLVDVWRGVQSSWPPPRADRWLAWFVLAMLVLAFVLALLPPYKWDVLTYHLAGPEQYVAQGRFFAAANNHFLGFPQLVEVLFAAQLALTGQLTGAGLVHWWIGVGLVAVVGGYAARHGDNRAGWWAAAFIVSAFTVWLEMTMAYVDLMPMALAVIGLSALDESAQEPSRQPGSTGPLVLAGIAAGLALGTKYSTLWLVIALGVVILWNRRRLPVAVLMRDLAIYGVTALLVFAPWLVRNVVWYDNPVYPLVFEAAEMDSIRLEWYSQPQSGLIYGPDAWQIPVLPLAATAFGAEGLGTFGADVGPLFLLLTPLMLLVWRSCDAGTRQGAGQLIVFAGTVTAAWMISAAFGSYISLQTRLVLYLFGPLAILAAWVLTGLRRLPPRPIDLGFVVQALVVMALIFMAVTGVRYWIRQGIERYFSGEETYRDDFLNHALGWHYATLRRLDDLPAGVTVQFLWEPRTLYCDDAHLTCIPDSLMDRWYHARRVVDDGSPEAIARAWRDDRAVDYLLVYEFGRTFERDEAPLYTEADWVAWDRFVEAALEEVWRTGNAPDDTQYILYRWKDAAPTP